MSARELFEKYKVEINKHDFGRVQPFISDDCTFWFSSGTNVGIAETRKAFEKTWSTIREEIYSISGEQWISESDTGAVCIYTFHWAGLIEGVHTEGRGRGTSCFRLEGTEWKIVHEHLSGFPK